MQLGDEQQAESGRERGSLLPTPSPFFTRPTHPMPAFSIIPIDPEPGTG